MEIGPRALGNRSILTAPFPAEMKDILNSKVKHREAFRPFAPIVRLEECGHYFESDHESPYMLLTYRVRDSRAREVPAITHVDGTARVQTVTPAQNSEIYDLITEFKRQTGVGVILNTSFNVMGQPIVETPETAIECFMGTQMDYLVFNNKYLVEKK
jgi:carbamoyltransferase